MHWVARECSTPGDLGHIHTCDEGPPSSTTGAHTVFAGGRVQKEEVRHEGWGLSTSWTLSVSRGLEHGLRPSLFSGLEKFQKSSGEEMVNRNNSSQKRIYF